LYDEVDRLNQSVEDLTLRNKELDSHLLSLKEQLITLADEKTKLEDERKTLQEEKVALEKAINQYTELVTAGEEKQRGLEEEKERLAEELANSFQLQVVKLEGEKAACESLVQQLTADLEATKSSHQKELEAQKISYEKEFEAAVVLKNALESEVKKLRLELNNNSATAVGKEGDHKYRKHEEKQAVHELGEAPEEEGEEGIKAPVVYGGRSEDEEEVAKLRTELGEKDAQLFQVRQELYDKEQAMLEV
jgi:hypothetical protein